MIEKIEVEIEIDLLPFFLANFEIITTILIINMQYKTAGFRVVHRRSYINT